MAKNAAIAVRYITIRTCSWSNCPCKSAKYRTYRSEIPVFVKCYEAFAPKGAYCKTIKLLCGHIFDVYKSNFIAKIVKNNVISTNRSGLYVRVRRNLIRNTGRHFLAYKISPSHHAHCFPGAIEMT